MTKETRQPFTQTGEYHARRGFRFHGRDYAPGDEFPWRQLSCSARKLKLLYEGRFIDPGPAPAEEPEAPPVEPETPVIDEIEQEEKETTTGEGAEDPGVSEEKDEETKEPEEKVEEPEKKDPQSFKFNPKKHKVVSVGSGGWKVTTKSGKHRLSVTSKEAQRLKKVKKTTEVRPEEIVE